VLAGKSKVPGAPAASMPKPLLTILMALKGRNLHTLRFLSHANKYRLPYHFLLADGAVNEDTASLLENPDAFPNITVEYLRFPDDVNYEAYFKKLASAAQRITTPYAMQVDNDDFLVQSGIAKCIDFLDENPDFVGASGGIGGFSIHDNPVAGLSGVTGRMADIVYPFGFHYFPRRFDSKSLGERIASDFRGTFALYYCVFRTAAFQRISTEIAELNMSDLQLYETYFGARAKTMGKTLIDPSTVAYMRQYGTSTSAPIYNDWIGHLVQSRFTQDLDAFVTKISDLVAAADEIDVSNCETTLRQLYADKLRAQLRDQLGFKSRPNWHPVKLIKAMSTIPFLRGIERLARRLRDHRMQNHHVREKRFHNQLRSLFVQLKSFGAPSDYLSSVRNELDDIFEILEGREFEQFAMRQMDRV
jgi:glycosyltransferase domain-containing protein